VTLKTAALLAFAGALILTVLLAIDFVRAFVAFTSDLVPVNAVIRSLIYLFASATVAVFFGVFSRNRMSS
jgi:hypothetical protein